MSRSFRVLDDLKDPLEQLPKPVGSDLPTFLTKTQLLRIEPNILSITDVLIELVSSDTDRELKKDPGTKDVFAPLSSLPKLASRA